MGISTAIVTATAGAIIGGGWVVGHMPTPVSTVAVSGIASKADTYAVDNVHSSVLFKVGYMGVANFYGRFNQVSGEYTIDLEDMSACSLDVTIAASSVDSNNADRDKHLRGADFFSAKEFPQIRFVATGFESMPDGTIQMSGELTLRGVTKTTSATLEWLGDRADPRGGHRSGFDAALAVTRSDFGVNYGIDNGALGDDVEVTIALTGMRQ